MSEARLNEALDALITKITTGIDCAEPTSPIQSSIEARLYNLAGYNGEDAMAYLTTFASSLDETLSKLTGVEMGAVAPDGIAFKLATVAGGELVSMDWVPVSNITEPTGDPLSFMCDLMGSTVSFTQTDNGWVLTAGGDEVVYLVAASDASGENSDLEGWLVAHSNGGK